MKELFTAELMEKAKLAKSPEELITLAKENGTDITAEEAANYFAKLNQKSGDIADEELENVAGGGCYNSDGRLIVTGLNSCEHWSCINCGRPLQDHVEFGDRGRHFLECPVGGLAETWCCDGCGHCSAAAQYIVCNHPANHC